MPNFDMKHWHTGKPMTLLEAFGITSGTLRVPPLQPQLPKYSGKYQKPIAVEASGGPIQQSGAGSVNYASVGGVPRKGKYQAYARNLLNTEKWSGQFGALNNIIIAESGWNPHIKNPGSGAYGIAQALGHGNGSKTQGTEANEYGGFGLTDKQAKEANSGNGYWQLVWMMNYIRARYGSPNKAWAFHQANGTY